MTPILSINLNFLFKAFNDIDSVIEHTLSKSADNTKLCDEIDTLEGWDAIQRDSFRLEQWALINKPHEVQ